MRKLLKVLGWALLPAAIMALCSNLAWALLLLRLKDPALAGEAALRAGPPIWSAAQLILLWVAVRGLRKAGTSGGF